VPDIPQQQRQHASGLETDAGDFFPPDAIPPLSQTRVTATQIARLFEYYPSSGMVCRFRLALM
jgi:hypothetical protein